MADQRTMAELLRAPIEGYAEAITVPTILAEQFELKHSLINMMTSDQFFGLEKDNPHDHIYCDAHPYYQCLTTNGNTFSKLRDNIQGYVIAAAVNYNQGNSVYHPSGSGSLPSNTIANPKGELTAITTRSGIVLDGPFVPIPPPFINPEEDERVEETLTDHDLIEYTIKKKLQELENTLLNENYLAVILKKLPENLGDPGKFLIPCGFSELKCKALADLGASINLMPLSVWKKLAGIAGDVFVPVGKFTFPADFVIVDFESDPRVPLILGRPFLRSAHALIDVHDEETILRDGDERLTLNMRHDTSSYSNQPQKESINLINVFNDSSKAFLENLFSTNPPSGNPTFSSHPILTSLEVKDYVFDLEGGNVLSKKLLDLDSTKDLHPPHHINPLSGSTISSYSPNHLLEEFANELALITFPMKYDNALPFDIDNLADPNDNLVDTMPEMFTEEHALDYSSPSLYDEYDDDLFKVEFDTEYVYDDPFTPKEIKSKNLNS
uniref:Reverse transcriptase domain-containing protein n=1 Tax=Tanacetum cinerariifolium TaxID=118510 RepID=A0A699HAZ0_TANCI|nr:reverse transcriptase domain-containing protein [Tanacetum cinerariifolium]